MEFDWSSISLTAMLALLLIVAITKYDQGRPDDAQADNSFVADRSDPLPPTPQIAPLQPNS